MEENPNIYTDEKSAKASTKSQGGKSKWKKIRLRK